MGKRFSAIDIGSNAIRMIVGEATADPSTNMTLLKKFRAPVRLGRDVFLNGEISKKTLEDACEAFAKFTETNKKFEVVRCRAVATSAVREAKNKQAFVEKIFEVSRIRIEIIDGVEEARLVHQAVRRTLDLNDRNVLAIDIGGGSVEITFSENGMMSATESFPMGTVRMLDQMNRRKLSEKQLNVIVGEFVVPLRHYLDSHAGLGPLHFAVGTGGNLECMAKLKLQILKKTPNNFVTLKELGDIAEKLQSLSLKERIEKLELRPDRVDVIVPAILLIQTILRQAQVDKIFIPNVGLRDGLLWSTAGLF